MKHPDIPEQWLRNVWQQQLFERTRLTTSDGRSVHILSPGTPNNDEGPDFLRARIRIGETLFSGDVEIHRTADQWISHGHDRNPHYNSVILHVVLSARGTEKPSLTRSRRPLPLLVLPPPVRTLLEEHRCRPPALPEDSGHIGIPCASSNSGISRSAILSWLTELSDQRLEMRIRALEERVRTLAREAHLTPQQCCQPPHWRPGGPPLPQALPPEDDVADQEIWDQLLYEGVMEGLGYAKNRDPFLALARSLRLNRLASFGRADTLTMMSLLLGTAGLLPSPGLLSDKASRLYVWPLHRRWNEVRPGLKIPLLHEGDWLSFRLRPVNVPTARLAAMTFLLDGLFPPHATRRLSTILAAPIPPPQRINTLLGLFAVSPDDYWRHHINFNAPSGRGVAVGRSRALEIIINTVIPLTLLQSRIFNAGEIERKIRELYDVLPAPSTNRITGAMRRDLVGLEFAFARARIGQGALQMYRFYCTDRRCADCGIGRLLKAAPCVHAPPSDTVRSSAAFSLPRERGCCSESNDSRESSGEA